MKKFLIIFLIVAIIILGGIAVLNSSKEETNIVKAVTCATNGSVYSFYDGDKLSGVEIEISKEIAKELGAELNIEDLPFASLIESVKSEKADFAISKIDMTEERKQEVDFSVPYGSNKIMVLVKKDSGIKTLEDLKNKKISVLTGSSVEKYVEENYPEADIISESDTLSAIQDVIANKADAAVSSMTNLTTVLKENEDLMVLDEPMFEIGYGIVIKKGNTELLEKINKVIERLINEGKIDQWLEQFEDIK